MSDEPRPLLRVVKGSPSAEEVAALVAVVTAAAAAAAAAHAKQRPRSEWAAPHRRVRGVHRHGGGAWRFAGR